MILKPTYPVQRPLMSEIEWHGPKTGWPTETRYLQQRLKGRGSRRRLNDVVVRRGGHVARLLQEESMLKRIDSDGLRVKFNGVSGCTSRQFRRELEEAGEVHLCRQLECRADHSMHIQEFAGVDHEALLDLTSLRTWVTTLASWSTWTRALARSWAGGETHSLLLPHLLCEKGDPCHS